jgi:low temperature requirement protein LtrA
VPIGDILNLNIYFLSRSLLKTFRAAIFTTTKSIVSPEYQKVTFVELFFDLVFVFSVTQVVGLFHDELNLVTVGKAILVFWLVWRAWAQFTWALNAADTTHPLIQLATLVAT